MPKVNAGHIKGLTEKVLAGGYESPVPVPKFHEELWEMFCDDHRRVAIAAPRGHAKSTAITHAAVITTLLLRERKYVLIISDTEEQSAEFIADIKREFTDNDLLRGMWEVHKLVRDQSTDTIIQFKDGHQCRIIGKGSEQKIRGRKWRGTRPDLIVVDDLENEELTSSQLRREKLKKWFYGSVLPAGSSDCKIRIVGTIIHFDSLLNSLMPPEDLAEKGILRDWYKGDWYSALYRAHPAENDYSVLLWEDRHSEEYLRMLQRDYARQGIPEVYAAEILNNPISVENAYFREQDLREMTPEMRDMPITAYGSADLAISEKDRSAYTVMYAGGPDDQRRIQVRDRRKGRWSSDRIIEEMFSIVQAHNIKDFFLESENIAKGLGPIIEEEMRRRGVYFTLHKVQPSKDKEQRASPLRAMTRAGMVYFDSDTDWFVDSRNELLRFPKGRYKDDADALGLLVASIQTLVEPPTPEEEYEEEYQEMVMEMGFGRDGLTGY